MELVKITIRIMSASLLQGVFLLDATFICINMCTSIYKKLAKAMPRWGVDPVARLSAFPSPRAKTRKTLR